LDDLDSDKLIGFEVARELDLAMDTSTDLVNDLILVDELTSGDEVLLDLSLVGSTREVSG
jgi:hypothetical protein